MLQKEPKGTTKYSTGKRPSHVPLINKKEGETHKKSTLKTLQQIKSRILSAGHFHKEVHQKDLLLSKPNILTESKHSFLYYKKSCYPKTQ